MAQIQGLVLPANIGGALGGSPQDAAKAFMEAASKGMATGVRDALTAAIGEALGGVGGPAPDWTEYVTSLALDMTWSTPRDSTPRTLVAFAGPAPAAVGGANIGISIGITASF